MPHGSTLRWCPGFNPRAHAGRDLRRGFPPSNAPTVSIHAPTRGATANLVYQINTYNWFQSTRPRGARPDESSMTITFYYGFNPRAHAGRDTVGITRRQCSKVSIHAPTRGATCGRARSTANDPAFQSTRPRGARRALTLSFARPTSFNPRAHAGRDASKCVVTGPPPVFQSTRPRGARLDGARSRRLASGVSIHAPTRGATTLPLVELLVVRVSIHAPTRGATDKPMASS